MKMAAQIEREMEQWAATLNRLWGIVRTSKKYLKKLKTRAERRRAKIDPECLPMYRRYGGWDW